MKILAINSGNNPDKHVTQVDVWRIWRPLRELKKHVDWQIDERPTLMKHIEKYKTAEDFTKEELEKTYNDICSYDIIWASYSSFLHGMVYALAKMAQEKKGVKVVIDCDDNMFSINPTNIGWWSKMSHEKTHELQTIIRDANYITTTNDYLGQVIMSRKLGDKLVKVVPNYISEDYKHPKFDNGDKIVVGYFGGVSHYGDLHSVGMTQALEKLMHGNKNIYFKSVGMEIEHYLPRKRYEFIGGLRGHAWVNKLFPTLNIDIALAPLTYDIFNLSKSDIKWQESSLMGAAFVGSNVRPYADTVKDGVDGLLVNNNEEDWYNAIKKLVDDATLRKKLVTNAQKRIKDDFLIENNWTVLKKALEEIHES